MGVLFSSFDPMDKISSHNLHMKMAGDKRCSPDVIGPEGMTSDPP